MKKIQLSIIFTLLCFATYAQFDSTSYVLGGTADFSYDEDVNKRTYFSIRPSIARPIKGNVLIGVELGLGVSSIKYDDENNSWTSNSISFDPGVFYQRFYGITDKIFFNWKARGNVSFNKSVTEGSNSKTTEHSTAYQISVSPGISWKVMDRVLLNGSIGGAAFHLDDRDGSSTTSFSIFFNNPQFGFSLLLN